MSRTFRRTQFNKKSKSRSTPAYWRKYRKEDIVDSYMPVWKHFSDAGSLDNSERKQFCRNKVQSSIRSQFRDSAAVLKNVDIPKDVDALEDWHVDVKAAASIGYDYT